MTNERFKNILEKYENRFMFCFEYFCEEQKPDKKKIDFQTFQQLFPQWLIMMQPDVFVMSGGNMSEVTSVGVEKIVNYLIEKHK